VPRFDLAQGETLTKLTNSKKRKRMRRGFIKIKTWLKERGRTYSNLKDLRISRQEPR
jgi:hypothetical protein